MTRTAKERTDNEKAAVNSQSDIPDLKGFQSVTPEGGQPIWWKPEAGKYVLGRLVGRFPRANGKGHFYQIKLLKGQSAEGIQGSGEDAKTVTVKEGGVLNMDERSAMEALVPYAKSDGVFNVFIHALEKVKLQNGNTWWRLEVKVQTVKPPTHPLQNEMAEREQVDDMGLPF